MKSSFWQLTSFLKCGPSFRRSYLQTFMEQLPLRISFWAGATGCRVWVKGRKDLGKTCWGAHSRWWEGVSTLTKSKYFFYRDTPGLSPGRRGVLSPDGGPQMGFGVLLFSGADRSLFGSCCLSADSPSLGLALTGPKWKRSMCRVWACY